MEDDNLFDEASAVARRVAALPQRAARNVKWVLNRAIRWDLERAMSLEIEATVDGFLDPETRVRGVSVV